MIHFVVPGPRAFGFQYFLDDWAGAAVDRFAILPAEQFLQRTSLPAGTYVFAVDDLLPAERRHFSGIWDQVAAAAPVTRVLNDPARTMGRLEFLTAMFESGRNRFRAGAASEWPAPLRFPAFVRERERHTGSLTPLLHSATDVTRALRWLEWKGLHRNDLLVVEYCETADREGVHRKYGAYIVGNRIVARSIEFSANWMVKHDIRMFNDARIREEREYVEGNPHEAWLRESFALANVSYGRMDYALVDGMPQAFEINLNPTIGRFRPLEHESEETLRLRAPRRDTNAAFYRRFIAAWEEVDAQAHASGTVQIVPRPDLATAAVASRRAAEDDARRRGRFARLAAHPLVASAVRTFKRLYIGRQPKPR